MTDKDKALEAAERIIEAVKEYPNHGYKDSHVLLAQALIERTAHLAEQNEELEWARECLSIIKDCTDLNENGLRATARHFFKKYPRRPNG